MLQATCFPNSLFSNLRVYCLNIDGYLYEIDFCKGSWQMLGTISCEYALNCIFEGRSKLKKPK